MMNDEYAAATDTLAHASGSFVVAPGGANDMNNDEILRCAQDDSFLLGPGVPRTRVLGYCLPSLRDWSQQRKDGSNGKAVKTA